MALYDRYKTDKSLETKGIKLDFGDFRVTVARAGGANARFARVLSQKSKPYRRAIQTDTMDDKKGMDILCEAYSEAVILGWETKKDGKWKEGIETEDGKIIPATEKNIYNTLCDLPDLFMEIQEQATTTSLFISKTREEDLKN